MPIIRNEQVTRPISPEYKDSTLPSAGERKTYNKTEISNIESPLTHTRVYTEGYQSWVVDSYYHQILTSDEGISEYSYKLDAVQQQYTQIDNFTIKVTEPVTSEYRAEKQEFVYKGAGVIFTPNVVPNKYDIFLADLGLDRKVIFSVSEVKPPFNERGEVVYEVSYISIGYYTDKIKEDLKNKSSNYYIQTNIKLNEQQNTLLTRSSYENLNNLRVKGNELISFYADKFLPDGGDSYLFIPNQNTRVIDVFIQDFWYNFLDTSEYRGFNTCSWLFPRDLKLTHKKTLWDLILSNRPLVKKSEFKYLAKNFSLQDRATNMSILKERRLKYLSIDHFYLPQVTHSANSFLQYKEEYFNLEDLDLSGSNYTTTRASLGPSYIFDEDFYKGIVKTDLESMVMSLIEKKDLDLRLLDEFLETVLYWNSLEQFYFIPLLLAGVKHKVMYL